MNSLPGFESAGRMPHGRLVTLLVLLPWFARAALSEPHNLLYGTIVIGNQPINAARTDVVVEARRSPASPILALYRMGADPRAGNFYALRIPIEALPPLVSTNASMAGDPIHLTLRDGTGSQGTANYTIPGRGVAQRIDFGMPVSDTDQNGLPDAWELAHFGALGQFPNADPDQDRHNNRDEWIAGTDPNDPNDRFSVSITRATGPAVVSFLARRADGPGFDAMDRRYVLQTSTNVSLSPWTGVPGFTNVPGNGQFLNYTTPATSTPLYYRGQVFLAPR